LDQLGEQTISLKAWAAPAQAAPAVHRLVVLRDGVARRHVPLEGGSLTIGRSAPADLRLDDAAVSRRHCRIERLDEQVVLSDLGSTNGTYLNGERLRAPARLDDGALVRVGAHLLRYDRRPREETEQVAALEREMQDASEYVAAILPAPILDGPVQVEWVFKPSTGLSGDAFGYRWLDRRWFTVFLLDVAGHGAAAALHAVSVVNALRQCLLPEVDFRNPAAVLGSLNRLFPMESHNERFFTIWYGAYDSVERVLRFASGGHHPAYLLMPGAAPCPLATRNPAIGMAPDRLLTAGTMQVPRGSALHLFSDGAFDLTDANGCPLDLPGIVALLPRMSGPDGPRVLYEAIRAHAGQAPLEDDFSALLLRFP
jgi:serine phosphatase RsbU (regulator of sigma subunit)